MYSTLTDITDRYGLDELLVVADRDNDGVVDAAVVDQALADATDEINVYVGQKYSLPLPTTPSVLKRLCVDIALYRLSSSTAGYTEEKKQRYDDAVRLLKSLAKGEASLGLPIQDAPKESAGTVEVIAPQRRFNRASMDRLT